MLIHLNVSAVCFQVSKISLVDLAGSERADSTGAKGTRLKVKTHFTAFPTASFAFLWGGSSPQLQTFSRSVTI